MRRPFNKLAMILAIVFAITASTGCSSDKSDSEAQKQDQKQQSKSQDTSTEQNYVAIVNGIKIPRAEVDRKIELIKKRYSEMGTPISADQLKSMKEKLINSLVEQEVLYQETQAQGISVDAAVVDSDYDNFKKQFKSEEDYQKQMKDLHYTEDILKNQIKKTKAIQQLIDKNVISAISVPDEELKAYFDSHPDEFKKPERVRARHILVKVDEKASDADKAAARKKIEGIEAQLKKGADFAKLAMENSDCPSSKNGGDLGFFTRGQMVKPFEDAAYGLKPGQTSKIVQTQFGYHIIRVEEKEPAQTITFDQVKNELQQKLKQGKIREALKTYMDSLKNKSKIELAKLEEPMASAPETSAQSAQP